MSELPYLAFHRNLDSVPSLGMIRKDYQQLRGQYPHLLSIFLPYKASGNGLPVDVPEHQRISKIEDKLENAAQGDIQYLGHVTSRGQTIALFMAKEASHEPLVIKTGLFKKEAFVLVPPHSDPWAWFESNAEPTEVENALDGSRPLYAQLAQHGDIHSIARPVDFASNFPTPAQRAAFLDEVIALGYRMGRQETWDPAPDQFWCEYVLDTAIDAVTLGPILVQLRKLSEKHGGDFDGWACVVQH